MTEEQINEALSRAEARMGHGCPDDLLSEAIELTERKVKVKGLPDDYAPLLLEDEICDACFRAVINRRCAVCA